MDSDPSDIPISNIPTLKLGSKHVAGNRPQPSQHNAPFRLFSLANTQTSSRGLTENEGSGFTDGQTTKRFGAPPVWNIRRQPFALQARRTNQSTASAVFSIDGAHTSPNTVAYPSKMVDYNERHYDNVSRAGTVSSPGATLVSNSTYLARAAPVTPAQGPEPNPPNPSQAHQAHSSYSASPHVASQDQDIEYEAEDQLTRAMKLSASQYKQHKNEIRQQRKEIEELRQRLSSLTTERTQEAAARVKKLADVNHHHSEELSRCKEAHRLELARIQDAAKAELDASVAEAKGAREETSRVKQMTNIHAERDQNDLQSARSKLEVMKGLAKKAVEESNQRYSELRTVFQDLKRKYEAMHGTLQAVSHELKDVRKIAGNGLKAVHPLIDQDAMSAKNKDTKALIAELQRDRDNSQQVNEILRGKLHVLSAQLADAQERAKDLEAKQIADEGKAGLYIRQLSEAGERIASLASKLDIRERDTIHALADAARLEEKLTHSEDRCQTLASDLEQKSAHMAELDSVKEETITLSLKLEESNRNFNALNASHQEASSRLSTLEERNQDLQTQISDQTIEANALRSQHDAISSEKTKYLADLDMSATRLRALEMQLNTTQSELEHSNLEMKLLASSKDEAVKTATSVTERCRVLEREKGDLEAKNRFLEGQIKTIQASSDAANASLRKVELSLSSCESKFSALEDRFSNQADALRASQNQCIDLQDRLSTAEAANITKVSLSASEWRAEAVALKEHSEARENQTNKALGEIKRQQDAMVATTAESRRQPVVDFERVLAQHDALYSKLINAQEQNVKAAERDIAAMQKKCSESDAKVQSLTSELANARAVATVSPSATPELEAQLHKQQTRIEELEGVVTELSRRAGTLFQRYQDGALDGSEKKFVDLLLQQARGVHEDDLVSKGNELRRRENTIQSLQAKVAVLESTLARRLQSKDPEVRDTDTNDSIINIKAWVLSSPATGDGMNVDPAREEMGINPRMTNNVSPAGDLPQGSGTGITTAFFDTIPTGRSHDVSPLPVSLGSRRTQRNTGAKNSHPPRTVASGPREQDSSEAPGVNRSAPPGFTDLDSILSDPSDFDDDIPISEQVKSKLGKHARPVSPIESPSSDPPKSTRRLQKVAVPKQGNTARRKRTDNAPAKSRKRKD